MLEETIQEMKVSRQFWQNREARAMLDTIIKAVQSKQPLQPYLYSLPMIDEKRGKFWKLQGAPLMDIDLSHADMKEAILSYTEFQGADLRGADLRGASLYYANFTRANLQGANLEGCHISGANFTRANLQEANLKHCNGFENNFTQADLSEADFGESRLTTACLSETNLLNTNFTDASLTMVQFEEENMKRAITHNTRMRKSGSNYVFSVEVIDESQIDLTEVLSPKAIQAIEDLERIKTIVDPTPQNSN